MYEFGKIVLVPFPFTDLSSTKLRPALIISRSDKDNEDVIVIFISSKMHKKNKNSIVISEDQDFFKYTGLKVNSVLVIDKIATLDKRIILGEIGYFTKYFLEEISIKFFRVFGFNQ